MANTTRTTFTVDKSLVEQARRLNIDVSAAAREGVLAAIRSAHLRSDQEAYRREPEQPDPFWDEAEAWGDE